MALAAKLSERVQGLAATDRARLEALTVRARLPVMPPALALPRWRELLARDKKVEAGTVRFILLAALGRAVITAQVSDADLAAVLT